MSVTVQRSEETLHVGVDKKGHFVGGWTSVCPRDPKVREIAEWAVNEYDKEKGAHLKFLSVVMAWTQVVAGTNYRLIIIAEDGVVPRNYEAYVWEKLDGSRQLTSFTPSLKE